MTNTVGERGEGKGKYSFSRMRLFVLRVKEREKFQFVPRLLSMIAIMDKSPWDSDVML